LIHLGDGVFGGTAGAEGDESESTGAGGAAFHGEEYVVHGSEGSEYFAEARFVGGVVQISDIQFNLLSSTSVSVIVGLGVAVAVGARRRAVIIVIVIVASSSAVGGAAARAGAGSSIVGHGVRVCDCFLFKLL